MIRLDADEPENKDNGTQKETGGMIKLVDAQDNQFVLSKGKDSTVPQEDPILIMVSCVLYD